MAVQLKFKVSFAGETIAAFAERQDAMDYAARKSFSEVRDRTGLIGQFSFGKPTPEFSGSHALMLKAGA